MPLLILGAERCALLPGTHTIGGRGVDALDLAALDRRSAVATLVVPTGGGAPTTIRRTTAAIVVRLDNEPLGIAAAPLHDGSTIDFEGFRIVYEAGDLSNPAVATLERDSHSWERPARTPRPAAPRLVTGIGARFVNVKTGETFALTDRRVVIGRDDTCDLVLGGKGVSRRHVAISPVSGGYLLRDLSANGTVINEKTVSGTYLLAHGDVVHLHDEALRFEVEGAAPAGETIPDTEATQVLDLSQMRALAGPSVGARKITAMLEIVRGSFSGATFELNRAVCSIGRARGNDVTVQDDSVSSNHATVLRKGTVWYVIDLHSVNGTFVDGLRVSGERELPSGAHLRLGAVELSFRSFLDGVEEGPVRRRKSGLWEKLFKLIRGPNRRDDVV